VDTTTSQTTQSKDFVSERERETERAFEEQEKKSADGQCNMKFLSLLRNLRQNEFDILKIRSGEAFGHPILEDAYFNAT